MQNVMPRKKTEQYVNNRELLDALIVYRSKVEKHFIENYDREPTKEDRAKGKVNLQLQTILVNVS